MYYSRVAAMEAQQYLRNQPDKFHRVDVHSTIQLPSCMVSEVTTAPGGGQRQTWTCGTCIDGVLINPEPQKELPKPRPAIEGKHDNE